MFPALPHTQHFHSKGDLGLKSLLLITQSLTLVRTRARDVPRLTTHPVLPLRRWSRAEIGAKPLVWSPTRPLNEPWFTGTGRLVALAITFATSASSLETPPALLIPVEGTGCSTTGGTALALFHNAPLFRPSFPLWHWPLHQEQRSQYMDQKEPQDAQSPSGESTKRTRLPTYQIFFFHSSNSFFSAPTVVAGT